MSWDASRFINRDDFSIFVDSGDTPVYSRRPANQTANAAPPERLLGPLALIFDPWSRADRLPKKRSRR